MHKDSCSMNDNINNSETDCSLYIHIPFCLSKCRYCAFYSEPVECHDTSSVIDTMIEELKRYDVNQFKTIYVGGGSPTCLDDKLLLRLIRELSDYCKPDCEFTVECNPGQLSQSLAGGLRNLNVNRLSIGAQSFLQDELDFLGRTHTAEDSVRAVNFARQAGFENISIDLIFAIPGSNMNSLRQSITYALDLKPDHISAYSLTYEGQTPLNRAFHAGEIKPIDEEIDREMYESVIDELVGAGFEHYEISNFALPGHQCRHNHAYWANRPYIGIGPGATSYYDGVRYTNIADIKKYTDAIAQSKSPVVESRTADLLETACETAVLNLRRIDGIDLEQFHAQTGYDARELFADAISQNISNGLLQEKSDSQGALRICLTRKALPIADTVLCDFSEV